MARIRYGTRLEESTVERIRLLSELTRITSTKLIDEALEDLFEKHKKVLAKGTTK